MTISFTVFADFSDGTDMDWTYLTLKEARDQYDSLGNVPFKKIVSTDDKTGDETFRMAINGKEQIQNLDLFHLRNEYLHKVCAPAPYIGHAHY